MPMRWVSGSCSTSRIRSMLYCRRDLPIFARCERPSDWVASLSGEYPGGLAQGPEEKNGRVGLAAGLVCSVNVVSPHREHARRWDRVARRRL